MFFCDIAVDMSQKNIIDESIQHCIEIRRQKAKTRKNIKAYLTKQVKRDGMLLRKLLDEYPDYMTTKIFYFAVKQNGLALQFVPDYSKSSKMCAAAVEQNIEAFKYAGNYQKDPLVITSAIEKDYKFLLYIEKHICLNEDDYRMYAQLALEKSPNAIKIINKRYIDAELSGYAVMCGVQLADIPVKFIYTTSVVSACILTRPEILADFADRTKLLAIIKKLLALNGDFLGVIPLEYLENTELHITALTNKCAALYTMHVNGRLAYCMHWEIMEYLWFTELKDTNKTVMELFMQAANFSGRKEQILKACCDYMGHIQLDDKFICDADTLAIVALAD